MTRPAMMCVLRHESVDLRYSKFADFHLRQSELVPRFDWTSSLTNGVIVTGFHPLGRLWAAVEYQRVRRNDDKSEFS